MLEIQGRVKQSMLVKKMVGGSDWTDIWRQRWNYLSDEWICVCMCEGHFLQCKSLQSYVVGVSVESARRRKAKISGTPFSQCRAQPTLKLAKRKAWLPNAFQWAFCPCNQLPFLIVSVRWRGPATGPYKHLRGCWSRGSFPYGGSPGGMMKRPRRGNTLKFSPLL